MKKYEEISTQFIKEISQINSEEDFRKYKEYLKIVKSTKTELLTTGKITNNVVRPEIIQSWKLCIKNKIPIDKPVVKMLPPEEYRKVVEKNIFLINAAAPVMATLNQTFAQAQFSLNYALTDMQGVILQIHKMGTSSMVEGSVWHEDYIGTNAISLAIQYGRTFTTNHTEHFCQFHEPACCISNVIHNADNQPIGTLNVAHIPNESDKLSDRKLFIGITSLATQLIEECLAKSRMTNMTNYAFNDVSEGILILNSEYKIILANKSFLKIINESFDTIKGIDPSEIFTEFDLRRIVIDEDSHLSLKETIISYKSHQYSVNLNIYKVFQGKKIDGLVLTCQKIKDIINLSNKYMNPDKLYGFDMVITQNSKMKNLIQNSIRVANTKHPILLEGESGTGKEIFAQSIHNESARKNNPFIAINCAAIPPNLIESELFGYEKGSFTGALSSGKPGKFELAESGTIFLDEIGEMPLDMQSKLLRVLDNNKIVRIGGKTEKRLNVRIIAATNRNLLEEIENKNFREDLYYRLNVINFKIPPLRERPDDISLLTDYFLSIMNKDNSNTPKSISPQVMEILCAYEWKGNVRELQNALFRAYSLCDGDYITSEFLPAIILNNTKFIPSKNTKENINTAVELAEYNLIIDALKLNKGKVLLAADYINMPKSTMYKKIKGYNIIPSHYK